MPSDAERRRRAARRKNDRMTGGDLEGSRMAKAAAGHKGAWRHGVAAGGSVDADLNRRTSPRTETSAETQAYEFAKMQIRAAGGRAKAPKVHLDTVDNYEAAEKAKADARRAEAARIAAEKKDQARRRADARHAETEVGKAAKAEADRRREAERTERNARIAAAQGKGRL